VEGIIQLKALEAAHPDPTHDDPDIVKIMVDFFYHQDYELEQSTTTPAHKKMKLTLNAGGMQSVSRKQPKRTVGDDMISHARVFTMAIKYGVPALKRAAINKFQGDVKLHWSHDTFPLVIEEVYNSTPEEVRELREIIARTILKNPKVLQNKEVEATIRSIDGLAFDLLKLKTNK
jgi:hypothetical protein